MEENKYLGVLKQHWRKGVYAFLILACIGVWSERLLLRKRGNSKQDYLIVNQIFDRYRLGNPIASESLAAAERVIKKHPELKPKYEMMLAHLCYSQHAPDKAHHYAASSLGRAKSVLPEFYVRFSEIALLIGEEQFEEAYQQTVELDQMLVHEELEQLKAFNLLRLVFLCDKTEREREEAYRRLKSMAAYDGIEPLFNEGALSLEKYLQSA